LTFTSNLKDERFDPKIEVGLYRIAQEALNNAVKHADATEIHLEISQENVRIGLVIKDNGNGFRTI